MPFSALARGAGLLAALLLATVAGRAAAAELTPAPGGGIDLRDGGSTVARLQPQTPPLRRGTAAISEHAVDGHRVAVVRIPVRGSARVEEWLVDLGGRPAKVLWSAMTGPRDSDGEVAVHVDVTADEIVEYQTAAQVSRCDGAPARLFPRAWDFEARRFRPVLSPLPAPAAAKLVARRDDPEAPLGRPAGGFRWVAASTTAAEGHDARGLTAPSALDDGNPATVWAEGLGGDGRGEFLTARAAAGPALITGLRFIPGDAQSAATFRARNRVRRFLLALGPAADQQFTVEIPADPAAGNAWARPYWVALPKPVSSACVTIVLGDVYRGGEAAPPKSFGTTAIADIDIFTDIDRPGGPQRLAEEISASAACADRVPLLASLGDPAVAPTITALAKATAPGRACLIDALARLSPTPKTDAAVEAFVAALPGASAGEEATITAALARAQPPPVAALEKRLVGDGESPDERARAARVLGALDSPAAAAALLANVGRGPDDVRAAVVRALGASPALTVEALQAAMDPGRTDGTPAATGDLLRLLPDFLRRHPGARAAVLPALRAAMAPERAFEIRGRAIMAAGSLRTNDGATLLAHLRAASPEPVLRYLAARELAGDPGAPATTGLRAALGDADPRVRETAAQALGERQDRAAVPWLIAGAKQEPWPVVRRAEIEALGRVCTPDGNDLLVRAVARDGSDVRRAALVGLARCRDPRAKETLLRALARHDESASTRALAATLLADLGDATAAAPLAAALRQLVSASEADLALESAAAAALSALARLGGAEAVTAAVALAGDGRHPFQLKAVEALGVLCDPRTGAATLRALSGGADAHLVAAARAAEKHCQPTAR